MSFSSEHPKWDPSPKFTPLTETTSIPPLSYASPSGLALQRSRRWAGTVCKSCVRNVTLKLMSRILSQPYSARIHISSISRNMSQVQNFVPTKTYKVTIAWYHSSCILYVSDDTLICAELVSLQTFFFSRFFCLWARVSEGSAQEPPWSVPIFFSLSLSPTPFFCLEQYPFVRIQDKTEVLRTDKCKMKLNYQAFKIRVCRAALA